jgi:hypothetical protein
MSATGLRSHRRCIYWPKSIGGSLHQASTSLWCSRHAEGGARADREHDSYGCCGLVELVVQNPPQLRGIAFHLRIYRSNRIRMIRGIGIPTSQRRIGMGLFLSWLQVSGWACGAMYRREGLRLRSRRGLRRTHRSAATPSAKMPAARLPCGRHRYRSWPASLLR